jgi:hypothetical protein
MIPQLQKGTTTELLPRTYGIMDVSNQTDLNIHPALHKKNLVGHRLLPVFYTGKIYYLHTIQQPVGKEVKGDVGSENNFPMLLSKFMDTYAPLLQ